MAGTEYRMDGLDEWEQELARAIEEQYPEEFKAMVIQVAMELARSRRKLLKRPAGCRTTGRWGKSGNAGMNM